MDVKAEIIARLRATPDVSRLVGTRVYAGIVPQGPAHGLPRVTVHRISTPREHDLDGAGGLAFPTIQVDCWADSSVVASELAEAVRNCLDGFSGPLGEIATCDVALINQYDFSDPPQDGRDHGPFRESLDFQVGHIEPLPTGV